VSIKSVAIVIFSIVYLVLPMLNFINHFFDVDVISRNIDYLSKAEQYQFGLTAFGFTFWWAYAFYIYIKDSDGYPINDMAGILGVASATFSLSGLAFLGYKPMVVSFAISGAMCIYCVSVPIYNWICERLKNKKFELPLLSVSISAILLYLLDGYSNIIINEIFGVSAKYFNFTKPIAMMLLSSPFLVLLALIMIVGLMVYHQVSKNTNTFYSINKLMACYVILILGMAFGSRAGDTIVSVASKFDFDTYTPCKESSSGLGAIVLDPGYNHVLVKHVDDGKVIFEVEDCTVDK